MAVVRTVFLNNAKRRLVLEETLTGRVDFSKVNAVIEELRHKAKKTGYDRLYSYDPVECTEKISAFCWKCKREYRVHRVYGGSFYEYECPNCCHTLTTQGGREHSCGGKFWLRSHRREGPECVSLLYKCSKCGAEDYDVLD